MHFQLKLTEKFPESISFEQISGDFLVYQGDWRLETSSAIQGTLLLYNAKLKPLFFAPPILVSFVQWQDLPGILKAHKQRAEAV